MSFPSPFGGRSGASSGPRWAGRFIRVLGLNVWFGPFSKVTFDAMMGANSPHTPFTMLATDQKGRLFLRPQFLFWDNNFCRECPVQVKRGIAYPVSPLGGRAGEKGGNNYLEGGFL